jgi:hypothetical protein
MTTADSAEFRADERRAREDRRSEIIGFCEGRVPPLEAGADVDRRGHRWGGGTVSMISMLSIPVDMPA